VNDPLVVERPEAISQGDVEPCSPLQLLSCIRTKNLLLLSGLIFSHKESHLNFIIIKAT
jgi:hypothetical protein